MFIMHINILFALSVLLASTVLIIWSLRNKGAGSSLGKIIGSLVFILSLISILCIGYSGIKFWKQGNMESGSDMSMGMRKEMMQKMMRMMMETMKEHMKNMDMKGKGYMEHKQSQEKNNEGRVQ
jgi:hypothetical protein